MMQARLVALAAVIAACGSRATITKNHGVSYRAVLQVQTANPASKARPPRGLDAQESTIIADSYRKSLAPEGEQAEESPMLVLSPQRQAPPPPAPSVPK